MKPGVLNLEIVRGDTIRLPLHFRETNEDGTPGDLMNLTGYTGRAQIRENETSATVALEFEVTIADQEADLGRVDLYAAPEDTALLNAVVYRWDMQLTAPNGDVYTYVAGKVLNTLDVTR